VPAQPLGVVEKEEEEEEEDDDDDVIREKGNKVSWFRPIRSEGRGTVRSAWTGLGGYLGPWV
jgi:hypothetical protein